MRNRILSLVLSLSIVLTLLLSVSAPIIAHAESDTLFIEDAEDLISFAKNCSYDLWSNGKTFVLTEDIDLTGQNFDPIPVFSGVFEGNGHTISGLNITGASSPAGLFAILAKDGVIRNLTVVGAVTPDGDQSLSGGVVGENHGTIKSVSFFGSVIGSSNVGGIAGVNKLSGSITDCLSAGEIIGQTAVGGITGRNEGLVSSGTSSAKVNTVSISPSLSLDEINLSLTIDITKLPTLSGTSVSDLGGIAGYSTGIIMNCINNGKVGYPHIGYNVGGIAGRSSGHINGCMNNAEVYGRKDVGGIVGQMEPYVNYDLSEDLLASLKSELDRLSSSVGDAISSAEDGVPGVSERLDGILTNLEGATDSLDKITGDLGEYGGDMTDEINRISVILRETLIQISSITSELPALAELLSGGLTDIEAALGDIDDMAIVGIIALVDMLELVENAALATESIKSALTNVADGLELFKSAVNVNDQEKSEAALQDISDGLFAIINATDGFTEKIGSVLDTIGDSAWMNSLLDASEGLAGELKDVSKSMTAIYESVIIIKENINVHWDEIEKASEGIVTAIDSFSSAIGRMEDALALMESGLEKIDDGIEGITDSVYVNDGEAVRRSAEKVLSGIENLVNAVATGSAAIGKLAEALRGLEDDSDLADTIGVLADSMEELAGSGSGGAAAFAVVAENLKVLFDNIEIDVDGIGDGGSLVLGGVADMTEALRKMRSAISGMRDGMDAVNHATAALSAAIVIEDREKIDIALENLSDAIGEVMYSTEKITNILGDTVNIMREAKLWGDNIIDSLSGLTEAVREITSAVAGLKDGVDSIRESIDLDLNSARDGLEKTIAAITDMADAAEHIKNGLLNLSDVLLSFKDGAGILSSLANNLSSAVTDFAKAMNKLGVMTEDINDLISYLISVDAIQLPTPPESITDEVNRLFIYISKIESELKYLNSDVTSMSSELISALGEINESFDLITDKIVEIIYGFENGDILDSTVTESEINSITNGRIFASQNNGKIEGDINVGGISGVMGLEYSLDPEDDLSPEISVTQKKQYQLKAVIHASKNYGEIVSKYDAVGGITGKMDFGLIYGCEAYGSVTSTAGDFVGGIAGIAAGRISYSFAKCALAGAKYVGGIIGCGTEESFSGDSSMVTGCYSMIRITRASQYYGAIAGANRGEFKENLFISDTLAGIDRVSYSEKAEPIEYEELIKRRSIPDGFYGFTLKFVADGVVLHTVTFGYGDSISMTEYPEIPKKDGHYGEWDRTELTDLAFDTTVSVVYTPYTTVISGGSRDEAGRDVFLVEGEFRADDKLTVERVANTDGPHLSERIFVKDSLVESWILTIPEDGPSNNTVHFLPPTDHTRIFVKLTDGWTEVNTSEFGSYLVFEAAGERVEIAVVRHTVKILPIAIIGGVVLIGATAAIVVYAVKKKKSTPKEVEEA